MRLFVKSRQGLWTAVTFLLATAAVFGQSPQPLVAIHDSELTRALEIMPASGATPKGAGTTGFQWWTPDWHYFVMPNALKEALRSDGTAFTVVGDSNIVAGTLLSNGTPRYPILISFASEAVRDDEIRALTNYVAAGGFLFIGASAFTRNTNGSTRGDFAFAREMGLHMAVPGLTNWTANNTLSVTAAHALTADLPGGQLTWRMPSSAEAIDWGISPAHPFLAAHDLWQVQATDATVIANGDYFPFLAVKPYGKGFFIYTAAFQPLIGHGGFAPGMYAYVILRRAVEWAFQSSGVPLPRVSPWPFPYDAAFMIRHDLENFTNEIAGIEASAQLEASYGAKGDYYFCTGTVRDDTSGATKSGIIAGLRRAVTNYNATIGPHNGGLKNPNNPALVRGQYDYWHWGPDEALDVTPAGYTSGKAYAMSSLSTSFQDVEGWLAGITNGVRSWIACYFNATREDSFDIQAQLNVRITGDDKLTPFPHWVFSTRTADKRYPLLSQPVSDWYVGGLVAQSLEPWHPPGVHSSQTLHQAIDFYYDLGALINFYSHTLSTGLGDAGSLVEDYIAYSLDGRLHPRLWSSNGLGIYQWWLQRSNVQMTVSYATNAGQWSVTAAVRGGVNLNTAIELLLPGNSPDNLHVTLNGANASGAAYRTAINPLNGQVIVKVRVGNTVTNVVVSYNPSASSTAVFSEDFDSVTAPTLPGGWTSSSTGGTSPWSTRTSSSDTVPNAAYVADVTTTGTSSLVSPPIALPAGQSRLAFRNNYNLEIDTIPTNGFDGGVLEISVAGGAFQDILAAGGSFVEGGYNARISTLYNSSLAGRWAWSGSSGGFLATVVNLPAAAAGKSIQLRWRCATDDGNAANGWYIDTVEIDNCVCACCWNTPPILPSLPNRTVTELGALMITNIATDNDLPAQSLTYSLLSPPAGAAITNGVIVWTPSEVQGPGTYNITTRVTDGGVPPLDATNTLTVVVTETNSAPILPSQSDRTIIELSAFVVTNTALDADLPANTLAYSLLAGPAGAAVSTNGIINWTPAELQGPGTNTFTIRVTDNGIPPFSATNSFTVVVAESNSPPSLPAQVNRTIAVASLLTVTNTAADSDLPTNVLAYALLVGPTNAVINTNNGLITWAPIPAQEGSTNVFTTTVTDYNPWAINQQRRSATNTFTVTVLSGFLMRLESVILVDESYLPTNNAADPGETVTMSFSLRNIGAANTTNLVATLLSTNGVVGSGAQTYGALVAGGAAVSRTFTFTAAGECGAVMSPILMLRDGTNVAQVSTSVPVGRPGILWTQTFEGLTVPELPLGWSSSASNAQLAWLSSDTFADSGSNCAFCDYAGSSGVSDLVTPPVLLPLGACRLDFRHRYSLEADGGNPTNAFDGGVLEIRIGTNSFTDVITGGGIWLSNGYNRRLDTHYNNPLAGRWAWSGTNGGYETTSVLLPATAAGQTIQLRWRCAHDSGGPRGDGWRVDNVGIAGTVCAAANTAPTLLLPPDQSIQELVPWNGSALGSDPDLPPNTLTFALVSGPTGFTISSTGLMQWIPTETQGPSTNVITVRVVDDGSPSLSSTNSFTLTVTEFNAAPTLALPADPIIDELAVWSASATGFDPDFPVNNLQFELVSGPSGLTVTLAGLINWTPLQTQSPSSNLVMVRVYDDGVPPRSATNLFVLTVREINVAPALQNLADIRLTNWAPVVITNIATNANIHSVTIGYTLLEAPAGAEVSWSGIITWTPTLAQNHTTNTFTTVATNWNLYDAAHPYLMATNRFRAILEALDIPQPVIQSVTVSNSLVTIAWSAVAGQRYVVQRMDGFDPANWTEIAPASPALGPIASATDPVGDAPQRWYRVVLRP